MAKVKSATMSSLVDPFASSWSTAAASCSYEGVSEWSPSASMTFSSGSMARSSSRPFTAAIGAVLAKVVTSRRC
jgi:hypothetical protein